MNFLLYIIVFLFIYNPPIIGLPMNSGVFVGLMCLIYYLIKYFLRPKKLFVKISKLKLWYIILNALALMLYSFMIGLVSGSNDFQLAKNFTSFLILFMPASILITNIVSKKYDLENRLKFIENIILIQSLIILIMFVNPTFKSLIFNILKDGNVRFAGNKFSGGFRFLGFSYGTTWDLAFLQSLALIFLVIRIRVLSTKVYFLDVLKFILIVFSCIVSGRTGFIGILFSMIILVLPLRISKFSFKKTIIFGIKVFIVLLVGMFLVGNILPIENKKMIDERLIPWAFELFDKAQSGKIETASSNELKEMYFEIPTETFIVGDGYYVNPLDKDRYYMDTDAGYMRHILYYGILGTSLIVFFYFSIFKWVFKSVDFIENKLFVKLCFLLIFTYFFIAQIKGDILAGSDMAFKYLFVLCSFFVFGNSKRINHGHS